jgi:hypothetical protein
VDRRTEGNEGVFFVSFVAFCFFPYLIRVEARAAYGTSLARREEMKYLIWIVVDGSLST